MYVYDGTAASRDHSAVHPQNNWEDRYSELIQSYVLMVVLFKLSNRSCLKVFRGGVFFFHISVSYLFIHKSAANSLSSSRFFFSAGTMLPKGGAGAVWCHETVCQSSWTHWTWQIHRKSRMLVFGWRHVAGLHWETLEVCSM